VLPSQAMNEEDVEDLVGLDSSVTRKDALAEAGAEEQPMLRGGVVEGVATTDASAQVERV
jgi:hypothetical protein